MKKLLVAAIGAAAAFGAFAEYTNAQRFEDKALGETSVTALGSNWSEIENSSNTYTIVEMATVGETINHPDAFANETDPENALSVKTTFGKPLSFNVVSGGTATNLESNLYFDSLVKFTVCDSTPDQTYDGAKIIMWLQENEAQTATNLYVRAGYLGDGIVTTNDYICGNTIGGDFADKWHRVTIKAMPTISTDASIPGFAIFIDGGANTMEVSSDVAKWATAPALTEAAAHYGQTKIFPSIIQDSDNPAKLTLTCASFDGTGTLNDMVFTSKTPTFAGAEDYVAPKAVITVNDEPYGSETGEYTDLATAIAALNGIVSGDVDAEVKFALQKGLEFAGPLTIENTDPQVTIVIDLNGFEITNTAEDFAFVCNSPVTITDSSVAKTGAIVSEDAIYVGESSLVELLAGTIDGYIDIESEDDASAILYGGTVIQDDDRMLAEGKKFVASIKGEGYYDVVDKVSYTVKFISGEGSLTNEYTEVEGTELAVPTPAVVVGKTFSAWNPAIAGATVTVEANATYTAQYTNNIYTITFVIGESSSPVQKKYGSEITSVPEIPVRAGYTGAWDDDPAGDTVTGDKTYTYTYSAETYTITFVNEIGAAPASTNYTIESGAITLPTATTENMGVQFDGWTNATITAAITEFTPTAQNVGSFTLYAKWNQSGNPQTIDPTDSTSTATVAAADENEAISKTSLTTPTGVDAGEYKSNFDFSAKPNGDGTYTVTLTGIKESVKTDVAETAEAIVSGTAEAGTVTVPAGLYYKVTTYTTLGGTPNVVIMPTLSTGDASSSITKPGTTQGFIKVEMATTAAELAD